MAFNRIPPIQCLVTFEAVARLRSGSKAAEELTVTTSAVSHRIRQLEAAVLSALIMKYNPVAGRLHNRVVDPL